jgi:hypothetical protein
MFDAARRPSQSGGSIAAIFEQHVPLVEPGADQGRDDLVEAMDVIDEVGGGVLRLRASSTGGR